MAANKTPTTEDIKMTNYIITIETAEGATNSVTTDYLQGALNIAKQAQHICKCREISANISVYCNGTLVETCTVNPTKVIQL